MKKVLGLDLGTNSIGWALVEQNFEAKEGKILGMGSRIIPMDGETLGDFGKGNSVSQTSERTRQRMTRRLHERYLLRRERLHRVLNILQFLPKHYATHIDFQKNLGQFLPEAEPKLAYSEGEFLFKDAFNEMIEIFKAKQPDFLMKENGESASIPYDWTIYYLRKKALNNRLSVHELAWVILNFNQKRGYYQARGEEEETTNKREFVKELKVISITKSNLDKNPIYHWYDVVLENGWIYNAKLSSEPQWLNTSKEFLITEELDQEGNIKISKNHKKDKEGKESRKIALLPSFDEIDLMSPAEKDKFFKKIKAKTEVTIANSGETVGSYIFNALVAKPKQKIRGKLIRTIDRKFYKDELVKILTTQIKLQPELFTNDLYVDCVRELYRNNEIHQDQLKKGNFCELFVEDIIFYQRPLRSKKSTISNCPLEFRTFISVDKAGKKQQIKEYLKVAPKSNPYYQEFRLWQWIKNLNIYNKSDDFNVTSEFIDNIESIETLFEFLKNHKSIIQSDLIKFLVQQKEQTRPRGLKPKELKAEIEKYRWNYVEDKDYPCNETHYQFITRLENVNNLPVNFLTTEIEQKLWHIIYSVKDKVEYEKALETFAKSNNIDVESFTQAFKNFPPFKNEYGAYSLKAIKKLLPLMRIGKYWNIDAIDINTKNRIDKIIDAEFDPKIEDRVREKMKEYSSIEQFQGMPLWQAQYVIYNRHSESENNEKWTNLDDLNNFINQFKQHSLRNPIVEQVVTETLRVVKDIWNHYGNGNPEYFNEIHIELGREMKNNADDRKELSDRMQKNENTNFRIKSILAEMLALGEFENVRPYSPSQQEILKIYETGVLNSVSEINDDIIKISTTAQPSSAELKKYILWLNQKYRSPYTGEIIPLSSLFTPAYEIEHIIPQSRYFDDSLSNKVICESAVNKLKDNLIGLAFIKQFPGEFVECGFGKTVKVFTEAEYIDFVDKNFAKDLSKKRKLLLEDIPEQMIERQLNDTRYISKYISHLLSNLVRENTNDDGINSKNLISGNGKITTELKNDWGLNDVWNDLILPRFERMNEITNSNSFTTWNENHQKFLPTVPLDLSKNFSKKRIDHRHHAMDALVIACATKDHINLLNNQSAKSETKRYDLQYKLRTRESYFNKKEQRQKDAFKDFIKPWPSFTTDAKYALESIIVSFKQNLRVINKATNQYQKTVNVNGAPKKEIHTQSGTNWAIRNSLHKETIYAKVNLPWHPLEKGKTLTASRKSIDTSFDLKKINAITDTGIQKILLSYLKFKGNDPSIAFSPEGIEFMNKNIRQFNSGKFHQPILKVRIFEAGLRFPLGETGNKKYKYVEAAKGTNLFFGIYIDEQGKRSFSTIPFNEVIERQKQFLSSVPEINEKGNRLLFSLSPNDLVYVPTEEEIINNQLIDITNLKPHQIDRVYKMVSSSGDTCEFIKHNIASVIYKKVEYTTNNKMQKALTGEMVKSVCNKLIVSRLGHLTSMK